MNRRIFSLVCIALYALLDASIYCSQQKVYDARNKSVRGTKETNRSNEKNAIEFKQETQLKNNNPIYDEDDKESSCFNIFKRGKKSKKTKKNLYSKLPSNLSYDEMIQIFIDNNKNLPTDRSGMEKYIQNIFANDPEQANFLLKLTNELPKQPSKLKPSE
ncbi:fam-c protein [Plasmodium vinckei lentum]|uniref:Fam-c protein n=1 Tax=Plasmodium vinckei lentum TaxID=138297 RepID=A0A6V7S414_PLAVN|nr:fam-c protein [Plasmodium vinckei lentum]